jgi:hypothetical protein
VHRLALAGLHREQRRVRPLLRGHQRQHLHQLPLLLQQQRQRLRGAERLPGGLPGGGAAADARLAQR